ncbi:hypothetical protein BGZ76_006347, partial [Entomortierella beljakovae]
MFSIRAAFEFYLHARDFESSDILAKFSSRLQDMEDQLPVDELYKAKGLQPPAIITVNQLYSGGDVAVPMTAAYNLPNDEKPIKIAGSKLVIIKNVQEGKFEKVLRPIAEQVLDPDQLDKVEFEAFFQHVLMHEVAHSLGPHFLVRDKETKVRSALQEYHSAMEEAKAEISVGGSKFLNRISTGDREAIPLLVQVGKLIDQIFIRQYWSGNEALHSYIHNQSPRDTKLDLGLQLFKGPWGLDEERFIKSIKEHDANIHIPREPPRHANYYPDDIDKQEYLDWVCGLEGQEREDAEGYYHVVKRDSATGKLYAVPYSEEYKEFLIPAAKLLNEAADLVSDDSLAKFLRSRAGSFISNEYVDSDVD